MNLIKKIYGEDREYLEYDRPFVFCYDSDDVDRLKLILNEMHSLDTDLSYDKVYYNMVEIFNRLGLGNNDSICLHNMSVGTSRFDRTKEGCCSFNYSINSLEYSEGNVIQYYSSNELFDGCEKYSVYPGVKLSNNNESIYYTVGSVPCVRKYDIRINDSVTLTREYLSDEVLFMFEGIDTNFVIRIKKPSSKIVKGNSYILDNELELVNYLRTLTMPFDMMEVYKRICEISLNNDISLYPEITLGESNKVNNSWKCINLITLKNGEMDTVIRTIGDKKITCYGNDNWSYVLSDENVVFTINSGRTLRYGIEAKNEEIMNDYTDTLLRYDVSTARSEVEDTKRLVKERIKLEKKKRK